MDVLYLNGYWIIVVLGEMKVEHLDSHTSKAELFFSQLQDRLDGDNLEEHTIQDLNLELFLEH